MSIKLRKAIAEEMVRSLEMKYLEENLNICTWWAFVQAEEAHCEARKKVQDAMTEWKKAVTPALDKWIVARLLLMSPDVSEEEIGRFLEDIKKSFGDVIEAHEMKTAFVPK